MKHLRYGATYLPNPPCSECPYWHGSLMDMVDHCNYSDSCNWKYKNNSETFVIEPAENEDGE